jgi:hypothetical protein
LRVAERLAVRVAGQVLSVMESGGCQVETVEIDLGTGLRPWIEIRRGDDHWHVATVPERDALLLSYGIDPLALSEATAIEDGCE